MLTKKKIDMNNELSFNIHYSLLNYFIVLKENPQRDFVTRI